MRKLLKHSWLIIIASVAITMYFAFQLRGIEIQNTIRMFMPQKGESYTRMLKTEDQFGSMLLVGISLETTNDTSVITPKNIEIIRNITDQCELVENITSIDSLTNVDFIYGENGALVTGGLLGEDYSGSKEQISEIKRKIIDWQDMYQNVILSDDSRTTQIIMKINPSVKSSDQILMLQQIKKIVNEQVTGTDLTVRYYGDPVQSSEMRDMMMVDLFRLIPLVVLVVIITLYLSFHSLAGTVLPLLTVLMSTIWSCGLMAIFNVTFTLIASVIPVALIACGSAYGIHVISHYYEAISLSEGEMTTEKHLDAIMTGLKNVWIPVILAGVTTIAGFISLVTSPLVPLQSFAIFTALGVGFALILSITLVPALLFITPLKQVGKRSQHTAKMAAKLKAKIEKRILNTEDKTSKPMAANTMYNFYHFFAGTQPRIIILILAIVIVSACGIHKLVIDTAMINYFPESSKFKQDVEFVDKKLTGSNTLFFIVSGQENGDMTKPEILKAVDNMQTYLLKSEPDIGKIVSFTTFLKRMNQVMHVPFTQDMSATDSFAQTGSSSQSSSDDFGFSFGDESSEASSDDFGFDFGDDSSSESSGFDFGEGNESSETAVAVDFVDPNIVHSEQLNSQMTANEFFDMMQQAYAEAGGKNASVEDLVKKMQQAMNYNGVDYYEIPYDESRYPVATKDQLSDLVSQYLLLYSGSLDDFADNQLSPKVIRIQVQIRDQSTVVTQKIIQNAKDYAAKFFPEGYTIEATGNAEMQDTMAHMVVNSQMTSIAFSILMVFVILSLSFKSPIAGIIGSLPLLFTIMLNFMVMGFANIHLDLITSIIASVAVGIGIDYTIHFMETYRAERAKSDNLEEVTMNTFRISGQGIITNALAVGLGFAVLLLSNFVILRYVGVLVAIVMFSSSALALTVIPGLLNAINPKFMQPKK